MAVEYAPLIRVNSISPGTILTPLVHGVLSEVNVSLNELSEKYPSKRLGDPSEVANLAYFLCDSKCAFLTGENIVIDGGILAQGGWHLKSDNPYIDETFRKKYE